MAGGLKPSIAGLNSEVLATVISSHVTYGNANGLFDGYANTTWSDTHGCYWYAANTDYIEVNIPKNCNVWRCGVTSNPTYNEALKILRYNGSTYDDVTSLYPQTLTAINSTSWEKTISNLPAGQYKFMAGKYGTRMDSEWFLESTSPIGKQLTDPESGWKRFSINSTQKWFNLTGTWTNSSSVYTSTIGSILNFKFQGSKIRLIIGADSNSSDDCTITIDGIAYPFSNYNSTTLHNLLAFEKLDLAQGRHNVSITTNKAAYLEPEAVDIDDTGSMYISPVGIQLTSPESGWKRYDDKDSRILYKGTGWQNDTTSSGMYQGSQHYTKILGDSIVFKFYGSKLRILANSYTNLAKDIKLNIDGVDYPYSGVNSSTWTAQILTYEKMGLSLGIHTVTITSPSNDLYTCLDAIDIDSIGYLVHPILNQVGTILGMTVGDCIPCKYTAASNQAGVFTELGTCTADEIPITGTIAPNGLFYFVKTTKGTLVADRVLQTNISWDVLNKSGLIEGLSTCVRSIPILTGPVPELTESDVLGSNYDGWMCLDNTIGSSSRWAPTTYPEWLAYDYKKPTKIISYKVGYWYNGETSQASPKNFGLYGWDGTQWIQVDYQSNITWTIGGGGAYYKVFNVANPGSYTKYKFQMDADNGYGRCSIALLEFYEAPFKLVRSLSGGVAYADANGNNSTTDGSKGAWPVTNEWDKYIVNSDLGGKITKGDDNVWHWNKWFWCKETSCLTSGFTTPNSTGRVLRGNGAQGKTGIAVIDNWLSSNFDSNGGFRPVLEFIESDSKQSNLWY